MAAPIPSFPADEPKTEGLRTSPPPSAVKAPSESVPDSNIGPYQLIEPLGEGGFGMVYVAEQQRPVRRRVALKILKAGMNSKEVLARFEAERQALAMMDHPNVARVFDAGSTPAGHPYFVMELVPGPPLTEYCDQHQLSTRDRLSLFTDVCRAVQHAHMKGIIHRDLKPSNILVPQIDGRPVPKVIDFGIAKAITSPLTASTLRTEVGRMMGTPEYMSPEQAGTGGLDVDTRTDVYALGVVLFELLTGTLPLDPDTLRSSGYAGIARVIRDVEPPSPSARISFLLNPSRARRTRGSSASIALSAGQPASFPSSVTPQSTGTVPVEIIATQRRTDPRTLRRLLRGDLDIITLKAMEKDRSRRYDSAVALAADIDHFLKSEPILARPPSATYRLGKFVRKHRLAVGAAAIVALSMVAGIVGSSIGLVRARAAEQSARDEAVRAHNAEVREHTERLEAQSARADAEHQKTAAQENETRARSEATKAAAVSTFLQGLLTLANPDTPEGKRDMSVREALNIAAHRLDTGRLKDQPEIEAAVRVAIGTTYTSLGLYDQAEPHLRAALDLRRARLGPDHPDIADSLLALGSWYYSKGDYDHALETLTEALEMTRRVQPDNRAAVAQALHNVGMALYRLRRFDDADRNLRESLSLRRADPAHGQVDIARLLNSLGAVVSDRGKNAEAELLYHEALDLCEQAGAAGAPFLSEVLNNLGNLATRTGRYDEATGFFQRALEIDRQRFGETHPSIATRLYNLGILLMRQGNLADAEAASRQALDIYHAAFGPDHEEITKVLRQLAMIRAAQDDVNEADALMTQATDMASRLYGPQSADYAWILTRHAQLLQDSDRSEQAEAILRKALDIYRVSLVTGDPNLPKALRNLARNLIDLHKPDQAEPLFREILALLTAAAGATAPETVAARLELALALLAQRKNAEAEPLLVEGFEAARSIENAEAAERARKMLQNAAELYEAQGDADAAERWRTRLAELPG